MNDERTAYITLTQVPGIGASRLSALLAAFPTALRAYSAPAESLYALPGFSTALVTALKSTSLASGRKIMEDASQAGVHLIVPGEERYPELLRNIPDPPPILFAAGNLDILTRPGAVAVVGSRDHSDYGAAVCRQVAAAAAQAGIVVVSGMARGLDAVAHTAALDAGGTTIGVLGNGHGVIYPAANRALYQRVRQEGLLLSEFPPGERPTAGSFPRRNRLISGLSRVTVVVEAAAGSGALITASAGLEQGREVMAVPGNISSPLSVGTNRLIRDGAEPLLEVVDLLRHFPEFEPPDQSPTPLPQVRQLPDNLSPEERELAFLLGADCIHPDQLAQRCRRPVSEILGMLSGLEIAGVVEQGPGSLFHRV